MVRIRIWMAVLSCIVVSLFAPAAWARFVPPPIAGHVTDVAGRLTPSEASALERSLEEYRARTTNEIAVLILSSLDGDTIEDVAFTTFNAWKLGLAKKDNGVLIVIAPAERKVRIEVGKGLEGTLTDLRAKQIIDEDIAPQLAMGHYATAMGNGTAAIERTLGGAAAKSATRSDSLVFSLIPVAIILALFYLLVRLGRSRRSSGSAGHWDHAGYTAGGDGSWGGGGGGGGFSGGGGSSGGGGASGSF